MSTLFPSIRLLISQARQTPGKETKQGLARPGQAGRTTKRRVDLGSKLGKGKSDSVQSNRRGKEKLTKALGAPALPCHRDEETGDDGPPGSRAVARLAFRGFSVGWDRFPGVRAPRTLQGRHIHQLGPRDAIMPGTGTRQKPPVAETAGSPVDVKDQQRGKHCISLSLARGQAKSSASRHAMNASQPRRNPLRRPIAPHDGDCVAESTDGLRMTTPFFAPPGLPKMAALTDASPCGTASFGPWPWRNVPARLNSRTVPIREPVSNTDWRSLTSQDTHEEESWQDSAYPRPFIRGASKGSQHLPYPLWSDIGD
ncbi:hypothetical protein BKA56DRAFT_621718 [Ilyonectria sp. MPI-CAGE-AT-0026]|nr:hypothetical protein BKA56DRAFT_621718 [Ilyonectria sp. MPI-CAGE-AT-0026]